ncbi:MAG: bleomycin resistance protein [Microbacterium sp.]|nr:bleomycin resistance protein [Microbacterium sp.]
MSLALGPASLGIAHDPRTADAVSSGDRVALWFYVDDVDAAFAAAVRSGAAEVDAPTDMPWGERVAQVRDPDGHLVNLGEEARDG